MQTFSYDSLGRLKTAKAEGGPAPYDHTGSSTDYDYDPIGNLTSLAGTTLGYQDGNHKHAATHRNGSPAYSYDANGNMVTRVDGGTTYNQTFDVENRLITVFNGSNIATQFAYDASGQRLRTTVGPLFNPAPNDTRTITTYPFPGYEVEQRYRWMELCPSEDNCTWGWGNTATITRKTYFLGGQAIATRITGDPISSNNGFFYLHSDHLGSSSLLTYGNGQASPGDKVNGTETRYYPYGSHRLTPTTQLTERDFTGQAENLELGLVYYNARFYVPGLGRFLTADTIVPDPARPQSANRYSYVENNPTRFIDPTGHCLTNADGSANRQDDAECWEIYDALSGVISGLPYVAYGVLDPSIDYVSWCEMINCKIEDYNYEQAASVGGDFNEFMFILGIVNPGSELITLAGMVYDCSSGLIECLLATSPIKRGGYQALDEVFNESAAFAINDWLEGSGFADYELIIEGFGSVSLYELDWSLYDSADSYDLDFWLQERIVAPFRQAGPHVWSTSLSFYTPGTGNPWTMRYELPYYQKIYLPIF